MPKVIEIETTGGVDVLNYVEVAVPRNGPAFGEIRIKHTAIGVNFIDIYHRSGTYPVSLPCVLGLEAVGIVMAVNKSVNDFSIGDRVGYASGPLGAYSEHRDYPAEKAFKIPDFIGDFEAASILLKGMTVEYLFNRTHKVKSGDFILFHAAAGGVGLLACQWAKAIGARMIGTVSTDEKAALAKAAGCEFVINYKKNNVPREVMSLTDGLGVGVVYDGVGKETFRGTLDSLSDRGLFVSFGQSSGMIEKVGLHEVFAPKNLYYTRPSLLVYNKTKREIDESSAALFKLIKDKKIKKSIFKKYDLKNVAQAHLDLQSRKTTGSLVLVP